MLERPSSKFLHVMIDGAKRFIPYLHSIKCSCGGFQLGGILFSHAMTAVTYKNQHDEYYYSPYYRNKISGTFMQY